jgi:hypothetical protein
MGAIALKVLRRQVREAHPGSAAAASLNALLAQYVAEASTAESVFDSAAQLTRRQAQKDIVAAQRQRLILMRRRGLVSDQVFLLIQRELDHVELSIE